MTTKDQYLPLHGRRGAGLATRSRVTAVEDYGGHATSKLRYEHQGSQITADGLVCVLSVVVDMMPVSVSVDIRTMHGHDVAVDKCSGYNLIARKSLPLGWERYLAKESKVPTLAGAVEGPFSLSGVESLAVKLGSMICRAHFTNYGSVRCQLMGENYVFEGALVDLRL